MPIYEFQCPKCKTKFELLRPFSRAEEAAECPSCKCPAKRQLSTFVCFSQIAEGATAPIAGTTSPTGGCGGCSSTGCATCG